MADINLIPIEYRKKGINLGAIFSKAVGIALVLLVLSLLLYGGLLIYKKSLTKQIDDIIQATEKLDSKRDRSLETSIYGADKKLTSVENLFKSHLYWSKLFTKIEQLVVPDVYFSDMKTAMNGDKIDLTLSGNAKTYTGLAKQMVGFKEDTLVSGIDITDLKLSESGGLDFTLLISISKSILINQVETKQ